MDDYSWIVSNAVGLNATWAIFDGGRARANIAKTSSVLKRANSTLRLSAIASVLK